MFCNATAETETPVTISKWSFKIHFLLYISKYLYLKSFSWMEIKLDMQGIYSKFLLNKRCDEFYFLK